MGRQYDTQDSEGPPSSFFGPPSKLSLSAPFGGGNLSGTSNAFKYDDAPSISEFPEILDEIITVPKNFLGFLSLPFYAQQLLQCFMTTSCSIILILLMASKLDSFLKEHRNDLLAPGSPYTARTITFGWAIYGAINIYLCLFAIKLVTYTLRDAEKANYAKLALSNKGKNIMKPTLKHLARVDNPAGSSPPFSPPASSGSKRYLDDIIDANTTKTPTTPTTPSRRPSFLGEKKVHPHSTHKQASLGSAHDLLKGATTAPPATEPTPSSEADGVDAERRNTGRMWSKIGIHNSRKKTFRVFLSEHKYVILITLVFFIDSLTVLLPLHSHVHAPPDISSAFSFIPEPPALPPWRIGSCNFLDGDNTTMALSSDSSVIIVPYIFASSDPVASSGAVLSLMSAVRSMIPKGDDHGTSSLYNIHSRQHGYATGERFSISDADLCLSKLREFLEDSLLPICDLNCKPLPPCRDSCEELEAPCGSLLTFYLWNDKVRHKIFNSTNTKDGADDAGNPMAGDLVSGSLEVLYEKAVAEFGLSRSLLPEVRAVFSQVFRSECNYASSRSGGQCSSRSDVDQTGSADDPCSWNGRIERDRLIAEHQANVTNVSRANSETIAKSKLALLDAISDESESFRSSLSAHARFIVAFAIAMIVVTSLTSYSRSSAQHSASKKATQAVPDLEETNEYQEALLQRAEALTRENTWDLTFLEVEDLRDSLTFFYLIRKRGSTAFVMAFFIPMIVFYFLLEIIKRDDTTRGATILSTLVSSLVFFMCGNMFLETTTDAQKFLVSVAGFHENGEKIKLFTGFGKAPKIDKGDESALLIVRITKIVFKTIILAPLSWLKKQNDKRMKAFFLSKGGGYSLFYMIAGELPEIFFQMKALDELSRITSYTAASRLYTATLLVNCIITPVLFYFHRRVPLDVIALVDVGFDFAYTSFNIYLRLASRSQITAMSVVLTLFPTIIGTDKLAQSPKTAMRSRVVDRIVSYIEVLEVMFHSDEFDESDSDTEEDEEYDPDMDVKFRFPNREGLRNLTTFVLRNDRLPRDTCEMNLWTKTNPILGGKRAKAIIRASSVLLFVCGVSFTSLAFIKGSRADARCAAQFGGSCVWAGMSPKILFPDGVFGGTSCSPNLIKSIDASNCEGLEELPGDAIGDCSSLTDIDVRNMASLVNIPIEVFTMSSLVAIKLEGTPFSRRVDWSGLGLTELPPLFFSALEYTAEHIDVSGNSFSSLPWDSFGTLSELRSINASHNELIRLENINEIEPLQLSLDVSHNRLSAVALSDLVVDSKPSVLELDIRHNNITQLPLYFVHVYKYKGEVDALRINGNPLTAINWESSMCSIYLSGVLPEWLGQLDQLTELAVPRCRIARLPVIFPAKLVSLDLSGNDIAEISFRDLGELRELDLSGNLIKKLDADMFVTSMSNLSSLALRGNLIESISANAFANLPYLQFLDLSDNAMTSIENGIFGADTSSLNYLDLSQNFVSNLESGSFESLPALEILKLNSNELGGVLPACFDKLTGLKELDVSDNDIGGLSSGIFDELRNLTSIRLGYNKIEELEDDLFANNLETLEQFDIAGNSIAALPSSLSEGDCPRLLWISCLFNRFTSFPDFSQGSFPSVFWIGLGFQSITSISRSAFTNLPKLERIGLGNNLIEELPRDVFWDLKYLKSVWLYSNLVSSLDPLLFANNTYLHDVNLRRNYITAVPDGMFKDLENLVEVWLRPISMTNITEVGDDVINNTPNLEIISGMTCNMMGLEGTSKCDDICFSDCDGMCMDRDQIDSLGNGVCDSVPGFNYDCAKLNYDKGDCEGEIESCAIYDCNGSCMRDSDCFGSCALVMLIVQGDGWCDDGSVRPEIGVNGPSLNCEAWQWDLGDCDD
jgi:Leucine-rich repeat (LRR) protein